MAVLNNTLPNYIKFYLFITYKISHIKNSIKALHKINAVKYFLER